MVNMIGAVQSSKCFAHISAVAVGLGDAQIQVTGDTEIQKYGDTGVQGSR